MRQIEVIAEQSEPAAEHPDWLDQEVAQTADFEGVCVSTQDHAEPDDTKRARRIELPTFTLGSESKPIVKSAVSVVSDMS